MPSKINANETEVPMDLNDMDENIGETNKTKFTIDNSATEPEKIHITPGSPNRDDHSYLSK